MASGDPDRSRLAVAFRDVHAADRLVSISLRLQPLEQSLEVTLQLLPVLFLRDPIYSDGRILTETAVNVLQGWHIDQMRQ